MTGMGRNFMRAFVALVKRGMFTAGLTALAAVPAEAQSGVNIGTLACNVSGGIGYIITSAKSMACTFAPAGGPPQHYSGVIRKFGLDIGFSGEAVMTWMVFAPGSVSPGALQGSYAGASAEVSAGLGLGANALIGGFNGSIALQPLSIQGQTGLNVAAGVASLELRAEH
jgi:Protein of unknown function (DUF992)